MQLFGNHLIFFPLSFPKMEGAGAGQVESGLVTANYDAPACPFHFPEIYDFPTGRRGRTLSLACLALCAACPSPCGRSWPASGLVACSTGQCPAEYPGASPCSSLEHPVCRLPRVLRRLQPLSLRLPLLPSLCSGLKPCHISELSQLSHFSRLAGITFLHCLVFNVMKTTCLLYFVWCFHCFR